MREHKCHLLFDMIYHESKIGLIDSMQGARDLGVLASPFIIGV